MFSNLFIAIIFPLTYSPVWTLTERIFSKNDPKAKNKPCTNERLVKIVLKNIFEQDVEKFDKSNLMHVM